jgi:hypothetical protein
LLKRSRKQLKTNRATCGRRRWALLKTRISRRYPGLKKGWHVSKRLLGAR